MWYFGLNVVLCFSKRRIELKTDKSERKWYKIQARVKKGKASTEKVDWT